MPACAIHSFLRVEYIFFALRRVTALTSLGCRCCEQKFHKNSHQGINFFMQENFAAFFYSKSQDLRWKKVDIRMTDRE